MGDLVNKAADIIASKVSGPDMHRSERLKANHRLDQIEAARAIIAICQAEAADEIARLRKRLEVVEDWSEDADGIACRNDTIRLQDERIARLREERRRLVEALKVADDAIKEMFRYYDGGETRGSYDGKPERAQLRKAGYATRAMIAALQHKEPQP